MKKILSFLVAMSMLLSVVAFSGAAEAQPVTLTFIERYGNPSRTASLRGILDDFEAQNPDIKVELLSPPLESSQQKITQMLMAKNDLDLLEVTGWERSQYIENGWIAELTDYYKDYPSFDTMTESVKLGITVDGKLFTVPIGSYERMIYYRKDWMDELGLSFPEPGPDWTYDALYDIAVKMTDPAKGRYGWALRGAGNSYQQFVQMVTLAALGSEGILAPEEFYFLPNGESYYRSDAAKKGVAFQQKFYKDCAPQDSIAWLFADQVNAFSSGICGLLMQDADCLGIFGSNMEDGTWATYPMPVDAVTHQGTVGRGADGWAMTSYTQYPEQTWRLLAFLGTDSINARFCKDYGVIPVHTTAGDIDPIFKTGSYAPYVFMYSHPELYTPIGGAATPYDSFNADFGKISDVDLQNILLGNADVDATLEKWAKLWEDARAEFGGLK